MIFYLINRVNKHFVRVIEMKPVFYILILINVIQFSSCKSRQSENSRTFLYVGSYTDGNKEEGIFVYELNQETGKLLEKQRVPNLVNPSFLTIAPNKKFLYACTDTKMEQNGSLSAFEIDTITGKLSFINKQTTGGRNPVHVVVDEASNYALVSNFTDAGISVFECNNDGSVNEADTLLEFFKFVDTALFQWDCIDEGWDSSPRIHSCCFSPNGAYVFAPDLGANKIRTFTFDNKGTLAEQDSLSFEVEMGFGPRHFTFHPSKPFGYCVEELSGSISFYTYANGKLTYKAIYASYKDFNYEYSSADIHISPDGKFLYSSNRQYENSITIFQINQLDGTLTLINRQSTFGKIPRSFVIDPSGNFLIVANQITSELVVFRRDLETGLLTKIESIIGLKNPSSLKIVNYSSI